MNMIDDHTLIHLIRSEDYVDRFKGEYYFVERKLTKLEAMLERWRGGKLDFVPKTPRPLLEMQAEQMRQYLSTLKARAQIEDIKLSDMDGCVVNDLVYRPEQRI